MKASFFGSKGEMRKRYGKVQVVLWDANKNGVKCETDLRFAISFSPNKIMTTVEQYAI
jgi:hypothetical protein